MDRKDECAEDANERGSAVASRDRRLDALDRHAEERDRLFIAALIDQDRRKPESLRESSLFGGFPARSRRNDS